VTRVFKYGPLAIGESATLDLPSGARVIAFSAQHGQSLWLWAEVDPFAPLEARAYFVVGTGHAIPESPHRHVDSWVSDEYVWHLFEAVASEEVRP
jgi:hypothetical protein